MAYLAGVLTLWLASGIIQVFSDNPSGMPEIQCNKDIVPERESLTCNCTVATAPGVPSPRLFWPGHSSTSVLTLNNVQREDNGTRFTCEMQGRRRKMPDTATFILKVAYGPSKKEPEIGCQNFSSVTDETQPLTLTCKATNTYPPPLYSWGGLCASNTDTCTCQPQPGGDNTVYCTATNRITGQHSTKSFIVGVTKCHNPPIDAPIIVANTNKTVLLSGDTLTCTVYGGKPLVASVNFHCTNPTLPDQPDHFEENSVSSTVMVNTTEAGETPMVCYCSAVWDPAPELYALPTSAQFHLNVTLVTETQPGTGLRTYAIVILALMVVPLVLAAVVILYVWKRRQSPRTSTDTTGAVDKRQSVESVGSTWSGHSMTVLV